MEFPISQIKFEPGRWAMQDPPESLYIQGRPEAFALLNRLPEQGLAVVGTRHPQPRSEYLVRRSIADLKDSELIILSGLALGIDSFAHEAALEAGLPTLAILGCGLGLQYPPENCDLRTRILRSGGLIISEYEMNQEARPHHFLNRNRLISGLSQATWIVQAPARSGALNTAKWAREEHRDCYVTPSFPNDPAFAGNSKLLDDGCAHAFWGAHSLGQTWLGLSTVGRRKSRESPISDVRAPESLFDALVRLIERHTAQSGGIALGDLLDWALGQGITPIECFESLQKAQQCGRVSDHSGIFASDSVTS